MSKFRKKPVIIEAMHFGDVSDGSRITYEPVEDVAPSA